MSGTEQPTVPEPGQTVNVVTDQYECIHCGAVIEVADFSHRTGVGYDTPTIRCQCRNVPMLRVPNNRSEDSELSENDGDKDQ